MSSKHVMQTHAHTHTTTQFSMKQRACMNPRTHQTRKLTDPRCTCRPVRHGPWPWVDEIALPSPKRDLAKRSHTFCPPSTTLPIKKINWHNAPLPWSWPQLASSRCRSRFALGLPSSYIVITTHRSTTLLPTTVSKFQRELASTISISTRSTLVGVVVITNR